MNKEEGDKGQIDINCMEMEEEGVLLRQRRSERIGTKTRKDDTIIPSSLKKVAITKGKSNSIICNMEAKQDFLSKCVGSNVSRTTCFEKSSPEEAGMNKGNIFTNRQSVMRTYPPAKTRMEAVKAVKERQEGNSTHEETMEIRRTCEAGIPKEQTPFVSSEGGMEPMEEGADATNVQNLIHTAEEGPEDSIEEIEEEEMDKAILKSPKLLLSPPTPIAKRGDEEQLTEEEDDESWIRDIEKLESLNAGFHTKSAFDQATLKHLMSIPGISEQKAKKLKEAVEDKEAMVFTTALQYHVARSRSAVFISTGSKAFDSILGGGFETGTLIELYGGFSVGKSQLCLNLAAMCQVSVDKGGGGGKCILIDTQGTFRPERVLAVGIKLGLNGKTVLDNVHYARAYNTDHQTSLLRLATALMIESRHSAMIVDSLTHLYRTDYVGRGELAERQQLLNRFLRQLRAIADQFNIAVILTNQVMANVGGGFIGCGEDVAVGEHVLAHAVTTRIRIRRGRGVGGRYAKIVASPSLPELETEFHIGVDGIGDSES